MGGAIIDSAVFGRIMRSSWRSTCVSPGRIRLDLVRVSRDFRIGYRLELVLLLASSARFVHAPTTYRVPVTPCQVAIYTGIENPLTLGVSDQGIRWFYALVQSGRTSGNSLSSGSLPVLRTCGLRYSRASRYSRSANRELRRSRAILAEDAYADLIEKGDRWPYLGAFLAQARFTLGRYEDAAEVAEVAASSTVAVERALGLGILARVRARSGQTDVAEGSIGEAVSIVEQTDFLFDRGTVFLDQFEVLRELGRPEESRAALERALGEFERKGDLVSSRRARSMLNDRID